MIIHVCKNKIFFFACSPHIQARGGLEALASASTGMGRVNAGFAPRDGSGGTGGGTAAETVGGVRIAAGPPPPAPAADGGGGLGLGGSGRWERESRTPSSAAVTVTPDKPRRVSFVGSVVMEKALIIFTRGF